MALACLLLGFSSAHAEDWQPPVPMPDEFDWMQLTSGEWLKGEFKVLYEKWDRINEPRRDSDGSLPEQDDYRLIFGLGYDF